MAEADQQFRHFISAETVVSALSLACAAPLTTKDARRRLKGYGDGAIGIVIMRPCEAAARRRDTGSLLDHLVGAGAQPRRNVARPRVETDACRRIICRHFLEASIHAAPSDLARQVMWPYTFNRPTRKRLH
jgi:hypothetical protein